MIQFNIFPGGKKRVVTFSYDDGRPNDARLALLFNKYGVKGTFHLNDDSETIKDKEKAREIYSGHEISCHTCRHGWLDNMPKSSLINEIFENRRVLEEIAGYPVVGMSYPSGAFSPEAEDALAACGIVYSRTVVSTHNFSFPKNFLEWHPTCHHRDAMPLCERFMANLDSQWWGPLFYIWGHSYEFDIYPERWQIFEEFCKMMSGRSDVFYGTNLEVLTGK